MADRKMEGCVEMKKDTSLIPPGEYCYRVERIQPGEILSKDVERYGKDLREYSYHRGYKCILCPYWRRTDYGTVICEYVEKEIIDTDDDEVHKKIESRFGVSSAFDKFHVDFLLADEIKLCGVGTDEDSEIDETS